MNKSQQIRNLKRLLGSKSDLIDLEAHIDGRLSYEENKRIVLSKAKKRGITTKSKLSFKGSPIFWFDKAEQINSKRKLLSRAKDGTTKAKRTFNSRTLTVEQFYKWKRNPRRYDIIGVDSKGTYAKPNKFKKLTLADIDKIDIL